MSIRAIDPSAERFLADLNRINARAARAQRQISSGLRVAAASDDPERVGDLLTARMRLDQTVQIRANLGRAKAEVDTAEQSIQSAVKMLERAAQLGVQGASNLQTPATRRTIGTEVEALLEELVLIAATRVEGRYVFSGDADQAPPYTLDLNQPNGVSAYAGSSATREVMHPAGARFGIARTAQEIFDSPDPGASVFAAVNALRVALLNGPTVPEDDPAYQGQLEAQTAAIDAALLSVRSAQAHLNVELSFYGGVQTKVKGALDFAYKLEVRQQNILSAVRDADVTAAAIELNQARIHQEAALSARAHLPQGSLFDYLG